MSSDNSQLPPLPLGPSPKRLTRQASVTWKENIILVGGDAPVRVQSMTNTDTADAVATVIQVKELEIRRYLEVRCRYWHAYSHLGHSQYSP